MADRPLGGASMSADSDKNDETQCILKSMQITLGMLVQKVSDIENKYKELRWKATDDDTDSVCDESMKTAPGRGEEDENTDACSMMHAILSCSRVGTDDNQSADGCTRGGSKNTHRDTDSISQSDFCITVA